MQYQVMSTVANQTLPLLNAGGVFLTIIMLAFVVLAIKE